MPVVLWIVVTISPCLLLCFHSLLFLRPSSSIALLLFSHLYRMQEIAHKSKGNKMKVTYTPSEVQHVFGSGIPCYFQILHHNSGISTRYTTDE